MRILAVDDDEGALRFLRGALEPEHEVKTCLDGLEAIGQLRAAPFDLVLADLGMPPPDGFEVLRASQCQVRPPPAIVITGLDTARAALEAMRLGARDYLLKPVESAALRAAVARVAGSGSATQARDPSDYGLIGRSDVMGRIHQMIPLLAASPDAVLILGETGTGKELLARAIHASGPRGARPIVVHNMAATPLELAESIFFGHVRGAFSGASSDHAGLFEQADSGTLFLDEIDSFPLTLQAKLLRALECGAVQRVGSAVERAVNVRVIAASAVDPAELVARGAFRADLYYRLRQLEVVLPPLRARQEDLPDLIGHFLVEASRGRCVPSVSAAAYDALLGHSWPGNCRELRHALTSAALLAAGGAITQEHLPRALQRSPRDRVGRDAPASLDRLEREHILRILELSGGNRSRAARLLGIDRGTLARRLKSLDL